MGVALGGVEEQVTDPGARNVLQLRRDVREDDTTGDAFATPFTRRAAEVGFTEVGEAEEPEIGLRTGRKDAQPRSECSWVDLDRGVSDENDESLSM